MTAYKNVTESIFSKTLSQECKTFYLNENISIPAPQMKRATHCWAALSQSVGQTSDHGSGDITQDIGDLVTY